MSTTQTLPPAPKPSSVSLVLNQWLVKPWVKPLVWLLCAVPFALLLWATLNDQLGANPAEALIKQTGIWTLRFLWLGLLISPLREVASLPALLRHRRALGVTAFVYVLCHFTAYAVLDKGLNVDDIVKDVLKRNFILVGMLALLCMTPLALTSFNRAVKALGGKQWQQLHKLVHAVVLLGLLHFYWKKASKNDLAEVTVYAVLLALLLGWRVVRRGGVSTLWRTTPAKPR